MSIRTITHNVSSASVSPETAQYGGVRFEDNATSVRFLLDDEFRSKLISEYPDAEIVYRIDFNGTLSGYNPSENLKVTDNSVVRSIPLCMTAAGEQITAVLVATAMSDSKAIGIVSSTPVKIYFDNVSRDETDGVEVAESLSAIEQKTREICVLAKTFSESASDSAACACAAADSANEAMIKTEESKVALENGSEFVFLGGDSVSGIDIDLVVDDSLSDVSENPVKNKVITKKTEEITKKIDKIADYIVEKGTKWAYNTTWTWEKWNSGKAICWATCEFNCTLGDKIGGMKCDGQTWLFSQYPQINTDGTSIFISGSTPHCVASLDALTNSVGARWVPIILSSIDAHGSNTRTPVYCVTTPYTDENIGVNAKVTFHAIGRWK